MPKQIRRRSGRQSRAIIRTRPAGIPDNSDAPFWRGDTADALIEKRVSGYRALAAAKKLTSRSSRAQGPRAPRSPSQQLRRLERALARRKTLAARQRISAQIKALQQSLDGAAS